jgi:hypothetical protein
MRGCGLGARVGRRSRRALRARREHLMLSQSRLCNTEPRDDGEPSIIFLDDLAQGFLLAQSDGPLPANAR